MIGSLDIHQAVVNLWNDKGLDDLFKNSWTVEEKEAFTVLMDTEASPSQAFPYCVFECGPSTVVDRSTAPGKGDQVRETREIALAFNVHAKHRGQQSAKTLAGELAEKITGVYGGHPTITPGCLILEHGAVLLCQFQSDFPVKSGDQEWQWVVNYLILTDVPVRL